MSTKQSSLARRQDAQRAALKAEVITQAAQVTHVALTDMLGTQAHQGHRQALERFVDARIRYNRWYRRLWRKVRTYAR